MAYTKTPEQSTHGEFRVIPIGNQTLTSVTRNYKDLSGRRYVNCYPMVQESPAAEQKKVILVKAPKVKTKIWTFPDTDVGITQYDYETNIFIYKNKIYEAIENGVSGLEIKLLETAVDGEDPPAPRAGRFVSVQKVIDYTLAGDVIVAGLWYENGDQSFYPYTYNKSTSTLVIGTTALGGGISRYYNLAADDVDDDAAGEYVDPDDYVIGYDEIVSSRDLFVDGYHVVALKANVGGTNQVLSSVVTDYNNFLLTTDYFTPEIDADNLVDIQRHKNYIVVFGIRTIEFYYNSGEELGSPFTRQENLTIRLGALQNLTANGGSVSVSNGDDIFFLSNALNGTNGVYMIREYQATKISDDYIDYLLNDEGGLTSNIDPSTVKIGLVDVMGNIQVGLEFMNLNSGELTTFIFNERDKIWWEYSDSDSSGLITTTKSLISNFSGTPVVIRARNLGIVGDAQYTISGASTNISGSTIEVCYVNKNPKETSTTALHITELQDLGNNKGKHIKYVDAIGDYGNNKIDLAFCTKANYSKWSSNKRIDPENIGSEYPLRWRNLCRAHRVAFKTQFVGESNIAHEALEVNYNIHTQ